jgi:ABC-type multidrug transport system ATPase subunit
MAVETEGLRKRYGEVETLHGVDLRVGPGSRRLPFRHRAA